MMLANVFLLLTRSLASAHRIAEILDENIVLTSPENGVKKVKDGSIDFENVSFKYREDARESALENVNLHIHAGQTIGVIGTTGSAKTTLVQLIPRLYDATTGVVRVGGVNVRDYDNDSAQKTPAVRKNVRGMNAPITYNATIIPTGFSSGIVGFSWPDVLQNAVIRCIALLFQEKHFR